MYHPVQCISPKSKSYCLQLFLVVQEAENKQVCNGVLFKLKVD